MADHLSHLLCRNCGKTGKHGWCKEVFPVERRKQIDAEVCILQEERARLKKQVRDSAKVCKNCAEFGHSYCSIAISDRLQVTELYKLRRSEIDAKLRQKKESLICQTCGLASCAPDCPKPGPLPPPICTNCAEFGHSKCTLTVDDAERSHILELYKTRTMERDMQMKRRRQDFGRKRMDYKRKRPEVVERENIYKQSKSYRDSCDRTDQMKKVRGAVLKDLLANVADHSRLSVVAGRPEELVSQAELDRVVAEYDFTTYKRPDPLIYSEAREALSYNYLTYNCCAVCGCDEPKGDTSFYAVSNESILLKLSLCIAFTEVNRARMPEDVQDQYNLRSFDARLDGLILCKFGLYTADHKPLDLSNSGSHSDIQLCVCKECIAAINEAKLPLNAIANGNYIGYLPSEFHSIKRTEEQTVALEIMQFFLHTIIGGDNKVLNSHTYLIKNPDPLLREFCHDVIGSILFTLVGAHVAEQIAMIRQHFPLSVDDAKAFLQFLDNKKLI